MSQETGKKVRKGERIRKWMEVKGEKNRDGRSMN